MLHKYFRLNSPPMKIVFLLPDICTPKEHNFEILNQNFFPGFKGAHGCSMWKSVISKFWQWTARKKICITRDHDPSRMIQVQVQAVHGMSTAVLLPSRTLRCHSGTVADIAEVDAKAPVTGWDVSSKHCKTETHETNATPNQAMACLGCLGVNLLTFKSCSCPQSKNMRL